MNDKFEAMAREVAALQQENAQLRSALHLADLLLNRVRGAQPQQEEVTK